MKTLLIFWGIAVLYFALLTFQSDGMRINIFQAEVERISREAAAGAISFFDAEAYAKGYLVVDEEAAEQFADQYIRAQLARRSRLTGGDLQWKVKVENPAFAGENPQSAVVTAEIMYSGEDFFRLPFLKRSHIAAQTSYEAAGR